ncbi:polyprenyl-phospho-N-acetylgalactosaminyl synthase [Marmoricola sp. URHA0025 HA25]
MDARAACVIVPAYNEAAVIAVTVSDLRTSFAHVIVIDDGSSDNTADVARAAGATVIRHAINRGQGAALQTGFDYFLQRSDADLCVTFDGDGQHLVEDAVAMVERAQERSLDVVLASRFLGRTEDMPRSRRLLLRAAIRFTRATTGLKLTDTHNGLRVLSRSALGKIRLQQDRMAYASELESLVARHQLVWEEVPTTVIYSDHSRAKGQTNSNAVNIVFDLAVDRIRAPR